ncbi:MAG: hypothetical protein MUE53_00520 [Chitinophagales bacterium]|jgi:hypothetical protein|nr:hypothetical protein [Chitinophagales bacterium]
MTNHLLTHAIEAYLKAPLTAEGFIYSESKRFFRKKGAFFESYISFYLNRHNRGQDEVSFEVYLNIMSLSYKKWLMSFYENPEILWSEYISGGPAIGLEGWSDDFLEANWYTITPKNIDLVFNTILNHINHIGLPYFRRFESLESGFAYLNSFRQIEHWSIVFDLAVMLDKYEEAVWIFEAHNHWEESELAQNDEDSYFSMNHKKPYLKRKETYLKIKKML